ncbi:MAG: zf-HC2 domain-containing protein [Desulfomonile tiedjei]|uniref:Zf-HC2 domain-containing protein n=1 Tax=Desulfomonile tiedjei TaxID=2358 RepID=A0A9D6V137_9BACT|nr:zf-HC2 domain-containing protein [Desulfomonile tiedjei]
MLNCREASQLISESLDKPLTLRQRMSLKAHLLMCRYCTRFQRQMLFLRDIIRRAAHQETGDAGPESSDISLTLEARKRIKDAMKRTSLGE